jgi:hypothetical protein
MPFLGTKAYFIPTLYTICVFLSSIPGRSLAQHTLRRGASILHGRAEGPASCHHQFTSMHSIASFICAVRVDSKRLGAPDSVG